jgi:hypothetical protein
MSSPGVIDRSSRVTGRVTRSWRSAPGWPTHLLLAVACGLIVWGARLPGGDVSFLVAGGIAGAVVIANWLVRALIVVASARSRVPGPDGTRARWVRWSVVPLVSAATVLAVWCGASLALAFRMSRPAMQRTADEIAGGGDRQHRHWIGLFPIARVQSIPGGVEFSIGLEAFPWGQRGFYYSSSGAPIENGHYHRQRRLDDRWFVWHYGGW